MAEEKNWMPWNFDPEINAETEDSTRDNMRERFSFWKKRGYDRCRMWNATPSCFMENLMTDNIYTNN